MQKKKKGKEKGSFPFCGGTLSFFSRRVDSVQSTIHFCHAAWTVFGHCQEHCLPFNIEFYWLQWTWHYND